jgi:hypothetical protein
MTTGLLGRDEELEILETTLRRAATGSGSVVLSPGRPGIGKTSVVRSLGARATVLAGACDDLLTPRTLGHCATPPAAVRPGWPVCWTTAVLQNLGVTGRRDAVAAVATFGIDATGATP